jgi:hypothetical protein
MNIVKANQLTTLVVNRAYMPSYKCMITAREAMENFSGRDFVALDSYGNTMDFEEWNAAGVDHYYENQPYITTKSRGVTHYYPVPTILKCDTNHKFFMKFTPVSLKAQYEIHNGICACCGEKKDISEMTIEHIYPKSLGGPRKDFNVTLTCQPCNNTKADIYPYYNHEGKEMKPKFRLTPYVKKQFLRDEWRMFLIAA